VKVHNLGSINIDHIFRLTHLPEPGETLQASAYSAELGGKGANQSLALAMGGAEVSHIGAMAEMDVHYIQPLIDAGVDMSQTDQTRPTTGSAVVMVDETSGENQIILNPAANREISELQINEALSLAAPGDWVLTQNETNNSEQFLRRAKSQGLNVCYSAAPFVAQTTISILPLTDLLIVNHLEAQALASTLNCAVEEIPVPQMVITLGAQGARYIGPAGDWTLPSPKVDAVDTTGAGDTFLGFFLAALTQGEAVQEAMLLAVNAAALQVTRKGTAEAIPSRAQVIEFMNKPSVAQ